MSNTFSDATTLLALSAASEKYTLTGTGPIWNLWKNRDDKTVKDLSKIKDFAAVATKSQKELNEFLKLHNLEAMRLSGGIGIISYFEFKASWKVKGEKINVGKYDYVSMVDGFSEYKSKDYEAIFCLATKSKYLVWLAKPKVMPKQLINFELPNCSLVNRGYSKIEFPFVSIEDEQALPMDKFIIGGMPVVEAKQLNLLKLTDKTVSAKSETRIRTKGKIVSRLYRFDTPFLIWITHGKTQLPLMVAKSDKKTWLQETK